MAKRKKGGRKRVPQRKPVTRTVAKKESQELTLTGNWDLTPDKIEALTGANIIPQGTPAAQVEVFRHICKARQLDPFSRQIYLLAYTNKRTGITTYESIVGIGGYRNIAHKTNQHVGTTEAKFNLRGDGTFFTAFELKEQGKLPTSATVTVSKLVHGQVVEYSHTCLYLEFANLYNGQPQQKWAQMPFQMLGKCAEAHALRKAWPSLYAGTSVPEERAAFEGAQIKRANKLNDNAKPDQPVKQKPAKDSNIEDVAFEEVETEPNKEEAVLDKIKAIDVDNSEALRDLTALWDDSFTANPGIVTEFSNKKKEIIYNITLTFEGISRKKDLVPYWEANPYWHTSTVLKTAYEAKLKTYE